MQVNAGLFILSGYFSFIKKKAEVLFRGLAFKQTKGFRFYFLQQNEDKFHFTKKQKKVISIILIKS